MPIINVEKKKPIITDFKMDSIVIQPPVILSETLKENVIAF